MLRTFTCKKCGVEFQKEMKSSYVWYCEDCRKKRNVEINPREILRLIDNVNILKIKDSTKLNYDLNELAKENNLKGIFIKKVLDRAKLEDLSVEEVEKIIEIGLEAMD